MDDAKPAETSTVIAAFFAALEAMDIDGLCRRVGGRWCPRHALRTAGFPRRLDGKTAIGRQYGGLPAAFSAMRFPDRTVYPMADPELALVEYRGEITRSTGETYNNQYCGVFHVQGGKLVHFTEYFDPLVLMRAFGSGDQLANTFSLPPEA